MVEQQQQQQEEWVDSSTGADLIGVTRGAFFYYVGNGEIEQLAGTSKRKTKFRLSDILRIKARREQGNRKPYIRKQSVTEKAETDWVRSQDLPYVQALDIELYGIDGAVPMQITQHWWKKNPYMCRVLFNSENRRDIWGAMTIMPLPEEIIFKILRDEMLEKDIQPEDILEYRPGHEYFGYVPSAMIREDKRKYFPRLLRSVLDFWCEHYPDIKLKRLYAFAASEEGAEMINQLFFSPRYDIGDNAFELDPYRRNHSPIIKRFQQCIQEKCL